MSEGETKSISVSTEKCRTELEVNYRVIFCFPLETKLLLLKTRFSFLLFPIPVRTAERSRGKFRKVCNSSPLLGRISPAAPGGTCGAPGGTEPRACRRTPALMGSTVS